MRRQLSNISITVILIVTLMVPSYSAHADATVEELKCEKPVKTSGPANQIESMAKLQTIITWSKTVTTKHSRNHSQWHYAKEKRVSCKRASGSRYFYCQISAAPCALVEIAEEKKATDPKIGAPESITPEVKPRGKAANRRAALERTRLLNKAIE